MIVFDFIVEMHPNATPPDFSKEFKKQETVDRKIQEWQDGGAWAKSPVNCVATVALIADKDNLEKDIQVPITENSVVQFVRDLLSTAPVVAEDLTHKILVLANTINHFITARQAVKEPTAEDVKITDELLVALSKLYQMRLDSIQDNFVHGNCHNPTKTLKWEGLDGIVLQQMLGLGSGVTRLGALYTLARRCGIS